MQLQKLTLNLGMTALAILNAFPAGAVLNTNTSWNPAKILLTQVSPSAEPEAAKPSETISLADLLKDKTYGNIVAPQDYKIESEIGDIEIKKGTAIATGIPLAAVKTFKDYALKTALEAANSELDPDTLLIKEVEFLKEISLKNLLTADPTLQNLKASLLGWADQGNKTLADISKTVLGDKPLPDVVLNNASIGQLGNIANTPFNKFPGAEKLTIAKFPGLPNIPIAKTIPVNLPTPSLPAGIHLIRVDKVRTQEFGAGINPKIVTGSDQRPKAQWTSADPVDVVEIRDSLIASKANLVNGGLMVDGDLHRVPGGNVPCPPQPVALEIPGTDLAVSAHNIDAKKGSVRLQLNMRLTFWFGLRTSYFIPLPVSFTVTEKSKTTLLFPLQVPQPTPVAIANVANAAKPSLPSAIAEDGIQNVATKKSLVPSTNPIAQNIANGNLGEAVKSYAVNPAIGGL